MSEILKSPTMNQKQLSALFENVFWCHISSWNYFHKHDIFNVFCMIIHLEKTLRQFNVKSVENISRKIRTTEHLQKKHLFFVGSWLDISIFQTFLTIIKKNLKLISSFPNNHYCAYTFLNPQALKNKYLS